MFKAFNDAFLSELKEIKNSFYKLLLITIFPILSFILIIAIFDKGVATNLPVCVVDKDHSRLSRSLLFNANATSTLDIAKYAQDEREGMEYIKSSEVYALLIIPNDFQKDVLNHKSPKVTVLLNTQYILIGKIIKSALLGAVSTSSAQIEFVQSLKDTQNQIISISKVSPIKMQITSFFNTYRNYFLFLVSAILPSIWQIFIVIATIVSFGSMVKEKKDKDFFDTKYIEMKILGKMLPYTVAFMILGILYLFYIYGVRAWIFEGSMAVMLFAMFLTTIAYQAIALALFATGFDYARALSLGAVYTAPAFAFLGVTFPVYNMNEFAIFWRDMLPVSYLVQIQISQANYGASVFAEIDRLFYISLFILILIPVFFRFRMRYAR